MVDVHHRGAAAWVTVEAFRGMSWKMTGDHLDAILKLAGGKSDKEGWVTLPEGSTMTLHVAHDGGGMTVPRVEAIKQDGELLYARNPKRELFALVRTDIFAIALEGEGSQGKPARRAGFG